MKRILRFLLVSCVLLAISAHCPDLIFLPLAFFFNCSRCCFHCTIFEDDFSVDLTGSEYTINSGSVTVSGGELSTTVGAELICDTEGTAGHGRAQVNVKISTTGYSARIIGSYVDASNYCFSELTLNGASSTLKLYKRVSGSNTQLGNTLTFTAATNTYYTIKVCWDGTNATGVITSGAANYATSGAFTGAGNKAGFRADVASGTVTFDEFGFYNLQIDNDRCEDCTGFDTAGSCPVCTSPGKGTDNAPRFLKVVVAGITDSTCALCDDMNGTYVLTSSGSGSGATFWDLDCDGVGDGVAYDWCAWSLVGNPGNYLCSVFGIGSGVSAAILRRVSNGDIKVIGNVFSAISQDPGTPGFNNLIAFINTALPNSGGSDVDCFSALDGLVLSHNCDRFDVAHSTGGCGTSAATMTISVL